MQPAGTDLKGKTLRYPGYQMLGQAKLHDNKDVVIMTPEMWNTYCYNFNALNGMT
jgi:hypothetical protein